MKKVTNQQAYLICDQLKMVFQSGVPLVEGLAAMNTEMDDPDLRKLLSELQAGVAKHGSICQAMRNSAAFDDYMVEMVRIGEKAGYLSQVMASLAQYYRRIDDMHKQIKDAVVYPGILALTMLLVIGIIVFKVFPVFRTVFNSLGSDLPAYALQMMNVGSFLATYGFIILVILAAAVIIAMIYYRQRYHDQAGTMFLSNFFITRHLMYDMAVAQFSYAFSLLIKSGYDSDAAIRFAPAVVTHPRLRMIMHECIQKLDAGTNFKTVITTSGIFRGIYVQMISMGIGLGKLDETMAQISDLYENEVNNSVDRFLSRIEPALTAILAVIVGIILLSVMLPLLSIMSSLG